MTPGGEGNTMIDSIHHYMPEIIFIGLAIFAATSRDI
jgi:hypothetical protein